MRLLQHISSLLVISLCYTTSVAQGELAIASDSSNLALDSTRIQVREGLFITLDYGKLATLVSDSESKFAISVGFQLANRISPEIQLGYASVSPQNAFENGTYESKGFYSRIGVNYLIPFDNTNMFYAGLRYGLSLFEDEGVYEISSDIFETFSDDFGEQDQTATWFEIVLGSEKKLRNEKVYLGGQFSLRFANSRDKFAPIDTYAIPGYGRTLDKSVPALNLYIKYLF
ncbi:MAG: DUF6048 family protein [Bacteroidota bacterium]